MNDPKIPAGAVDLGDLKALADEKDAEANRKSYEEARARAQKWDRAMTRAFKGVTTGGSPARRRQLARAISRMPEDA